MDPLPPSCPPPLDPPKLSSVQRVTNRWEKKDEENLAKRNKTTLQIADVEVERVIGGCLFVNIWLASDLKIQ